MRPVDLRTERRPEPLGLDERQPLFSWYLAGAGRDREQRGYHLRVTTGVDPRDPTQSMVWDTGKVLSGKTYDIAYGGVPLVSRMRYVWAVRVQDESGRWSGWSELAAFEMALLQESDWVAAWIGSQVELGTQRSPSLDPTSVVPDIARIWLPAGLSAHSAATFWNVIELPKDDRAVSAAVTIAGPGKPEFVVNGRTLATDVTDKDLLSALRPGSNEVVLHARSADDDPPGVIMRMDVRLESGALAQLVSDGCWQCAPGRERTVGEAVLAEAIGANGDPPRGRELVSHRPSPYLRYEFALPAPVRRARVYATALGIYELRVNGERVGDRCLSPGWTDFTARLAYQTYDVTGLLRAGTNTIGAVLADGWYAGHIAIFGPFQYGEHPMLRAQLEIEFEDGTTTTISTDDDWRVSGGQTRYADLQNGEVIDARREPVGWDGTDFDDHDWVPAAIVQPEHGRMEAEVAPPVAVIDEVPAVEIIRREDGAQIVDFGQNVVGWVRLRVRGERGTRILLRHAEMLDRTTDAGPVLYTDSLRDARCTDEFVLAGDPGGETFEPRFTVHGFRFCEVLGYPGRLQPDDVTAVVAHAAMERTGTFECSDPRLNRLHENIVWSQRGNFLALPTDCPNRDERMGWTGDMQVFAATAAFGFDIRGFMRKWLRDVRDAQLANGAVTHVAPDMFTRTGVSEDDAGGAAGWGDVIVVVPHVLARVYGDRRSIEENLDAIGAWLEYCRSTSVDYIRPATGFGDWLAVTETPRDLVATAFFAHCAALSADLAQRAGRPDLAQRWRTLHGEVRDAFRRRWIRGGGVVLPGTQTAYLLALHFGLFDDAERNVAAQRLVAEIRFRHWHLTTGFLGTPYLLPVLSACGHDDVAIRLLTQTSYPSWLYQVVHGDATTIWERWDSWSEARGFQDPAMTSFNHYAYGAVGDWMYRTLGGIEIGPDGPHDLLIHPRPCGLTHARASLRTVLGEVTTDWEVNDELFRLRLTVPVGAKATVRLPAQPIDDLRQPTVGSGTYEFVVPSRHRWPARMATRG